MAYLTCKNICCYPYNPIKSCSTKEDYHKEFMLIKDKLPKQKLNHLSFESFQETLKDNNYTLEDFRKDNASQINFEAEFVLPPTIAQLLRLRLAVKKCQEESICFYVHASYASEIGIETLKIQHICHWYCKEEYYSKAEQVALTYIDAITDSLPDDFEDLEEDLLHHFSEDAIKSINQLIVNFKSFTYVKTSQHYLSLKQRYVFPC